MVRSRVTVLHSTGAWSRTSVARQVPEAGDLILQQSGKTGLQSWPPHPPRISSFHRSVLPFLRVPNHHALTSSELSSGLALDAADLGFLTSVCFLQRWPSNRASERYGTSGQCGWRTWSCLGMTAIPQTC